EEEEAFEEEDGLDAFGEGAEEAEEAADVDAYGEEEYGVADSLAGEEEGFEEEEGADELEDVFAEAMDAEDEDEFFRRLRRGFAPALGRIARRAMPIGLRLLRQAAPQLGGIVRGELGGAFRSLLGGASQADAMDAFADVAADEAMTEDEIDEYIPVLGGL